MNYYLSVLHKYVNFEGRARRSEYWYFALFNTMIAVGLKIADVAMEMNFFYPIYILGILLPCIGVSIRRMHDVGKSGWYSFIPVLNFILACTEGDSGDNEYGADPKAAEGEDIEEAI